MGGRGGRGERAARERRGVTGLSGGASLSSTEERLEGLMLRPPVRAHKLVMEACLSTVYWGVLLMGLFSQISKSLVSRKLG